MELRHLLVATDESEAARRALRTGLELARRAGARVTVLRARPIGAGPSVAPVTAVVGPAGDVPAVEQLSAWAAGEVAAFPGVTVEFAVAFGLPGVEIPRAAENLGADLVLLGRKQRSRTARLLVGDTADSVARRSSLPCLFVPRGAVLEAALVALDGTARGAAVLEGACSFAAAAGVRLRAVTVERPLPDEPAGGATVPAARTERLAEQVAAARERWGLAELPLEVRGGDIVAQTLEAVAARRTDLLVVGYRRGGLPGVIDAGSIGRRLVHSAPGGVLTVPL